METNEITQLPATQLCVTLTQEEIGEQLFEDWLQRGIELHHDGSKTQVSLPPHGVALLGRSNR